jgi:hypothetical protein
MNKILTVAMVGILAIGGIVYSAPNSLAQAAAVKLNVPYIKEVPAGTSGGPWKNGCEEASMAMLEQYYAGKKIMNIDAGKTFMILLFNKENVLYGSNVNSDTTQVKYLVDNFSDYSAKIVNNPTIAQIKSEIDAGRPVITPHYGFDLHNPNIPFLRTGTSYHMEVIIGYDNAARQFIVNDSGDTVDGQNYRYGYDLFMGTIHDYSYITKKANGPARAVFTFPKLVKVSGSPKIYYLHDNISQYITGPSVIANHHWTWAAVNIVSAAWLNTFTIGAALGR